MRCSVRCTGGGVVDVEAEEPADFLPFLDDGGFFFFDGAFGFAGDGFEGVW